MNTSLWHYGLMGVLALVVVSAFGRSARSCRGHAHRARDVRGAALNRLPVRLGLTSSMPR